MKTEDTTPSCLELIERRRVLIEELGRTLAEGRADFVRADLEAIRRRIEEQENTCRQIRALDEQLSRVQQRYARSLDLGTRFAGPNGPVGIEAENERVQAALKRLAEAQESVKRLNDTHQAMLRRSRRTVTALLNLVNSRALIYSPPASAAAGGADKQRP